MSATAVPSGSAVRDLGIEDGLRAVFCFFRRRPPGRAAVALHCPGRRARLGFGRYWVMVLRHAISPVAAACSARPAVSAASALVAALALLVPIGAAAQAREVYRCPGNLYTDQITPKEALERGCKTLSGAPVTVVQSNRPRPPSSAAASGLQGRSEARIDPAEQRARDSDARRILEGELRKEEERLAQLQKDLAQGEAERRGDERNYAKYQERVAELKAAVARKEADVAAIRRELAKLPAP